MMKTPIEKIMSLIDSLPEQERMKIADNYHQKPEKELSSKVVKVKKIYEALDDEEKCDFVKLIGARKLESAVPAEEEVAEGTIEIEVDGDLDANKE